METLCKALFRRSGTQSVSLSWDELQAALLEQKETDWSLSRKSLSGGPVPASAGTKFLTPCPHQVWVRLKNASLWQEFHSNTNEMIITKAGRRMFPLVELSLENLEPSSTYALLLAIHPVDSCRWKYLDGEWHTSAETTIREQAVDKSVESVYTHPSSPNTGEKWMKSSPVGFSKLKLSNKEFDSGKVKLSSLHCYQPVVYLVKLSSAGEQSVSVQGCQDINRETTSPASSKLEITTHHLPETQFIAVTAYQNDKITQMKIKHNPFAKAFLPTHDSTRTLDTRVQEPTSQAQGAFSLVTTQAREDVYPSLSKRQCRTYFAAPSKQCLTNFPWSTQLQPLDMGNVSTATCIPHPLV